MNNDYRTYREWKGWDSDAHQTPKFQRMYFRKQLERYGIRPPGHLLEIGFGHGDMLKTAKDWGFHVNGIEILPELVEEAKHAGFEVECADMTRDDFRMGVHEGRYDTVLAMDVLEHLPVEASIVFLKRLGKMLKPQGRILLRFPNGGSPAGLVLQNGDHTHRQAITESKLQQLVCGTGLKVEHFDNTIRKLDKRSRTWWLRPVLFLFRDIVEICYGYIYLGRRTPLDKSCVAVLIRDA
jgi:2-polyprenyl-3-methyl-5-hydroxy-6-metoxy-1,4-benzoquinol methylase